MENSNAIKAHYDVVIVGARCAGASTAFLLARAGVKVLMIDRHQYGSDMVSTHALMKVAVLQLKRWGLLPEIMAAGTPEIRKTTFHYGDETIPIEIKPEQGVEYLCAPRRKILDRILVDAARKAGADVFHGVSLADLRRDEKGRVIGICLKSKDGVRKQVSCDLVVGADGRQSTVARKVGAMPYLEGASSSGYVYGYFDGITDSGFHWYFNDRVAAGLIPTNGGQHCVFVGVPQASFVDIFRQNIYGGFLDTAAANAPELHQVIRNAQLTGRLQGFVGLPGYMKQSYGPGWCLVGDACYFKDPLTAHGITDALRDAELLANAILAGNPNAFKTYQDIRTDLSADLFRVTEDIASFNWDIDLVKQHHGRLSNAMKLEMESAADTRKYASVAA
jgi:flavin-dependent dehydrogenase